MWECRTISHWAIITNTCTSFEVSLAKFSLSFSIGVSLLYFFSCFNNLEFVYIWKKNLKKFSSNPMNKYSSGPNYPPRFFWKKSVFIEKREEHRKREPEERRAKKHNKKTHIAFFFFAVLMLHTENSTHFIEKKKRENIHVGEWVCVYVCG